jgi:quercetin dioxygenase-like cupin family protein
MISETEPQEQPHQRDQKIKVYRFSDLYEEWMNEKLSRRIVPGRNEMLGYVTLKKGCFVPPHKHVSEQMSIMLKGALKFTINGKEMVVKEGEVIVIPPNVEHAALAVEDTIDLDCFSPPREDWLTGQDAYLRMGQGKSSSNTTVKKT